MRNYLFTIMLGAAFSVTNPLVAMDQGDSNEFCFYLEVFEILNDQEQQYLDLIVYSLSIDHMTQEECWARIAATIKGYFFPENYTGVPEISLFHENGDPIPKDAFFQHIGTLKKIKLRLTFRPFKAEEKLPPTLAVVLQSPEADSKALTTAQAIHPPSEAVETLGGYVCYMYIYDGQKTKAISYRWPHKDYTYKVLHQEAHQIMCQAFPGTFENRTFCLSTQSNGTLIIPSTQPLSYFCTCLRTNAVLRVTVAPDKK